MSVQLSIEAYLDDAPARAKLAELKRKNEEINNALEETEIRTKEAFNKAMGTMRASYMMVSGFGQIMGSSMAQMFTSMYGAAISAIGTYKAIASAIAASGPWGWVQAGIMFSSLALALMSLSELSAGQQKLAGQISGLNMSLQGFSQLIGSFNFS